MASNKSVGILLFLGVAFCAIATVGIVADHFLTSQPRAVPAHVVSADEADTLRSLSHDVDYAQAGYWKNNQHDSISQVSFEYADEQVSPAECKPAGDIDQPVQTADASAEDESTNRLRFRRCRFRATTQ